MAGEGNIFGQIGLQIGDQNAAISPLQWQEMAMKRQQMAQQQQAQQAQQMQQQQHVQMQQMQVQQQQAAEQKQQAFDNSHKSFKMQLDIGEKLGGMPPEMQQAWLAGNKQQLQGLGLDLNAMGQTMQAAKQKQTEDFQRQMMEDAVKKGTMMPSPGGPMIPQPQSGGDPGMSRIPGGPVQSAGDAQINQSPTGPVQQNTDPGINRVPPMIPQPGMSVGGMTFQPSQPKADKPGLTGLAKNQLWAKGVLESPQGRSQAELATAKEIESNTKLDPSAVDFATNYVLKTGQMPSGLLGFGNANARVQIMNNIGKMADTLGLSPTDVIASGAEMAANKGALNNLVKNQAMVETFSDFTGKQLTTMGDTLKNMEKKVTMFDATLMNKPIMSWSKDVLGLPEVQAHLQQLVSTRTEVSRLVAGMAQSTGGVPVEFLKEWQNVLSDNASPARQRAFMSQARVEIANRQQAFETEREKLRQRILKGANPAHADKVASGLTDTSAQPGDAESVRDELERIRQEGGQ